MLTKAGYNRALFFAAAGTILAMMACFILVAVWLPAINPEKTRLTSGVVSPSPWWYVVGTVFSVCLMILGKTGSDRNNRIMKAYKEQQEKTAKANGDVADNEKTP